MLTEMRIDEFTSLLASDAPAPGGGAAAALTGALGIALSAMVSALTIGKAKYAEYQEENEAALEKALRLKSQLLQAMEDDKEAYSQISAAYRLPKATEEESAERSKAIQKMLLFCTEPPLKVMELSREALELTRSLIGRSNPSAVSDLGVAAAGLKAAMESAWLNVLINISTMKNRNAAEAFRLRGQSCLDTGIPLAEEIYEAVLHALS